MSQKVLMPQMGESINEATLTKWHKKVGDKVEREEILFEISTDKVDTEIPSPVAGVLTEQLAKEGDVVAVNAVVAVVSESGAPSATASSPAAATNLAPLKEVVQAPSAQAAPLSSGSNSVSASVQNSASGERLLSSPLVRKMAEDLNVDLSLVAGTGENGRIGKQDLLSFLENKGSKTASPLVQSAISQAASPAKTATASSVQSLGGATGMIDGVRVERVAMTTMRRKIAEHMVMSKRTSPHVTSVIEIDCQKIVDLRGKLKDKFEAQHGFKLSFMPFFLHAAVEALKAVPIINSSVDNDTVVYKKDINLGVAVALDWGLIVPVLKNCSERSFVGIAREMNILAEKARTKKLAPDDVKGGTFSISNYGGFGTIIGQPIINQPQVAIMGMGAMTKKPVVINDAIAIRTMMYVVLSFDHRVIDGSDSGKFLSTIKTVIENWTAPVI